MRVALGILAQGLLLTLPACSNRLDLGHDRESSSLSSGGQTATSCAGVPCFAGPVIDLASSSGNAKGLVLDDASVFWAATSAQAILVTPKVGGVTQTIATSGGGPFRVAASATNVYFTSNVGGYVANLTKATLEIASFISGEPYPENIAVGDDGVYFADQHVGTVKRAAFDGSTLETLVTGIYSGGNMALDGQWLYYLDSGLGEIHALDRTTLVNQLLASGRAQPSALLVRGDDLYFLELGTADASYADGKLLRMSRGGGPTETLLENLDAPDGLAADASGVFICTRGTELNHYRGRILRRADDGSVSTLASEQSEPFAIAVDERAIYWTTDADSGLHALLR